MSLKDIEFKGASSMNRPPEEPAESKMVDIVPYIRNAIAIDLYPVYGFGDYPVGYDRPKGVEPPQYLIEILMRLHRDDWNSVLRAIRGVSKPIDLQFVDKNAPKV